MVDIIVTPKLTLADTIVLCVTSVLVLLLRLSLYIKEYSVSFKMRLTVN